MVYNLIYRMQFQDRHHFTPANWRIDFLQKDGVMPAEPFPINAEDKYGAEPLIFDRSQTNTNKFTSIIGSTASISYLYDGSTNCPHPDVFINIEEDTWMVIIYKNSSLYWKGFIMPDGPSYPFITPPFEFSMNATDYIGFMKGKQVNLEDNSLFLYSWITLGDFFNRTVFHTVGYNDASLKLLMNIKPKVLGPAQNIVNGLYVHTDAFYDFEKGPLFVYDCLEKFASSIGARFFYSAGAYWIQRIGDLDQNTFSLIVVTPDNLNGTTATDSNANKILGDTSAPCDLYYTARTCIIQPVAAIKQQTVKYKLQAYNRLLNFEWRYFNGEKFNDWAGDNPGSGLIQQQVGTGTVEDPFRNRMSGNDDPAVGAFIGQSFTVVPGQFINLQVKAKCNYTKGVNMRVAIIPTGGGAAYYMDSSGDWKQANVVVDPNDPGQEILLTVDKKLRMGSLQIASKAIPNSGGTSYTLILNIMGPTPADDPNDPVQPGESIYNEVYPAFLRIFSNSHEEIDATITNNHVYSKVPDDLDRFFLDAVDNGLSNCLYYHNGSAFAPLPKANWDTPKNPAIADRNIEEILSHNMLDQGNRPADTIQGDVYSNNLEFYHMVVLKDKGLKRCMLLKDSYKVRSCLHSIQAIEIMQENTGDGNYSVLPIQRTNQ